MKPLVTLVVPVYNEAEIIRENLATILTEATGESHEIELLAVDDGSVDSTGTIIGEMAARDSRIRLVPLTRNFGKEAAILAGLSQSKGDAVIVLDADLQHPPALIPQMLELWRSGICVVEAIKEERGDETFATGTFANFFYALFSLFAKLDLRGHSDFKLLDRVVVDSYLSLPERHRFFRGLIGWAGYPSAQVPFSVTPRSGGGGKWSKMKLFRYAIKNLTSFSSLPLKIISWLGSAVLMFGVGMGAISLIQKIEGRAIGGFTTVNLLIIITSGSILLSLGIIGHYLARLYDEVKGRPLYFIKPSKRL